MASGLRIRTGFIIVTVNSNNYPNTYAISLYQTNLPIYVAWGVDIVCRSNSEINNNKIISLVIKWLFYVLVIIMGCQKIIFL